MSTEYAPARPMRDAEAHREREIAAPEKYRTTAANVAMLKVSAPMPNRRRPPAMGR